VIARDVKWGQVKAQQLALAKSDKANPQLAPRFFSGFGEFFLMSCSPPPFLSGGFGRVKAKLIEKKRGGGIQDPPSWGNQGNAFQGELVANPGTGYFRALVRRKKEKKKTSRPARRKNGEREKKKKERRAYGGRYLVSGKTKQETEIGNSKKIAGSGGRGGKSGIFPAFSPRLGAARKRKNNAIGKTRKKRTFGQKNISDSAKTVLPGRTRERGAGPGQQNIPRTRFPGGGNGHRFLGIAIKKTKGEFSGFFFLEKSRQRGKKKKKKTKKKKNTGRKKTGKGKGKGGKKKKKRRERGGKKKKGEKNKRKKKKKKRKKRQKEKKTTG